MIIDNEFEVAAPLEQVWTYMLDVPRFAPCLPGTELGAQNPDGTYQGGVTTKMGPVSLKFAGVAGITSSDDVARRIVIDASGAEVKGKGNASMTLVVTMARGGRGTVLKVSQDLLVSGAAAQYGRGMISDVMGVLMKSFVGCIEANLDAQARGESAQISARPAQGFAIGVQAALLALTRVVKRFFGRTPARSAGLASVRR